MSEDLIITPGGPRPRSMVHKVETGHVIAMATGRLLKRHISGRVMADLGPVVVRPEVAEAPQKPLLPNPAVQWIVYATWTAPPGQPVVSFKTTWVVPPPPRTQNNQLIYLFNGIQNSSWIYQPVLQWGNSPDPGGGNYWSVASWLADGQNGPAFYSPLIRVNPGDVLTGIITLTRQYGNLFDYDCVFAGLPGSCLPIRGVQQLTNCVETLEAYDKTGQNPPANCSDYPFVLKTAMAAIEIRSGTGEMTLTWQKQNLVTACGQHAVPVSDKSPGGEVDLYYVNPAAPAAPQRRDHLQPNQGLLAGQALTSQDGRFKLILQADGNLVVYGPQNQPMWASNTAGHPEIWDAVMQSDGNFVLYDVAGRPLWASNTNGKPGATLTVQDDGNVVIYDTANHPLWATGTVVPGQPAAPTTAGQLLPGQGLMPGQSIKSPDGRFRLVLQGDGNLVLYGPESQPMWASNTAGHTNVWDAVMQSDGNLVIYDVHNHPLWASNTNGKPGATLAVQNDGNAVIYDTGHHALWATNSVVPGQPAAPTQIGRLLPGQGLMPGQVVMSANEQIKLVLQTDGNLVLYGPQNQPLWASNTAGKTAIWDAIMQSDGNLVLYDDHNHPLWASNTSGKPGATLTVQNDGNAVIYDTGNHPLWATNTVVPAQPPKPTQTDRLLPGQGLVPGKSIKSPNGQFTLMLQSDGNLVLYGPAPCNQPLWASNTAGHTNIWDAVMQSDGNLVLYDAHNHPLWASNTAGKPGARLMVQDDANVVIYSAQNQPLWSTGTAMPSPPSAPAKPDRLAANEGLIGGQALTSADGRFTFTLQTDANLVLYGPGAKALWASNTNKHTVYPWFVAMQSDGNLVIYDSEGKPYWASNTAGNPGAYVVAQSDGNVVIYNAGNHAIWATNTVQH